MMYTDTDGDQFTDIVSEWFQQRAPRSALWSGGTQKAHQLAEAEAVGFRHGASIGLAALGNQMRRDKFTPLPRREDDKPLLVPMFVAGDFVSFLRDYAADWESGVYSDMEDEEMWRILHAKFLDIVFDENFVDYYQATRRQAIMEDLMEASEEDAEWIDEEIQKQRSKLSPLEAALNKLERLKKVKQ